MRDQKKTTVMASILLALALSLTACTGGDDDNGNDGTVDPGSGVTSTTALDSLTTTTVP